MATMSLSSKDSFGPNNELFSSRRGAGQDTGQSSNNSSGLASSQEQRHLRSDSTASTGSGNGPSSSLQHPSRQAGAAWTMTQGITRDGSPAQSPAHLSRKSSLREEQNVAGASQQQTLNTSNVGPLESAASPPAVARTTSADDHRAIRADVGSAAQASSSASNIHDGQSPLPRPAHVDKSNHVQANDASVDASSSSALRIHGTSTKSSRLRDDVQRKTHRSQRVREGLIVQPGESTSASAAGLRSNARSDHSRSARIYTLRTTPHLPSAPNVKAAPPPAMYWSKAPVHGTVPRRSFRAHSASLADEMLWLFGGCDAKGCFRDLWCFDTETMCWSRPKVTGDAPPSRRAHTATMVDKRLFVFAGGDGPYYFNDLYVFDTIALHWSRPDVFGQPPSPRRAHTSNYFNGNLIIFGGGNGVGALNDVHTLKIGDLNRLEWRKLECRGKIPVGRGYHTSNLVDGKLIVIGGSDGHKSFSDIHILQLETQVWYEVQTEEVHCRLGHTATQVGSYLFVVGGHNGQAYTPDVLTLNLVNLQWEPRRVCGAAPAGRGYHQAWLRDSRLFVHGGFDGKEIFNDLFYIDLAAHAYLPQITSFSVELDDE